MPRADFSGVRAKLGRGDEHFRTLRREVLSWMEAKPWGYRITNPDAHDPKGKRRLIHVEFREPPPVIRWAVVFGDLLSCYRAALDHALYSLAVLYSAKDPPPSERIVQFPICDSLVAWQDRGTQRRLADLRMDVRAVIQDHQPYLREKPNPSVLNPLRVLRELNDGDKHRLLRIAALLPQHYAVTMERGPAIVNHTPIPGPVKHKAPVLELLLSEPPQPEGVKMEISITLGIGVENPQSPGGYFKLITTSTAIRRNVHEVIGDLDRFAR